MLNNVILLKDSFSLLNTPKNIKDHFLIIDEIDKKFYVVKNSWNYKCLKIQTKYSEKNYWVLNNISNIFYKANISIFAFTSIDYWYFFFDKKYLLKVKCLFELS